MILVSFIIKSQLYLTKTANLVRFKQVGVRISEVGYNWSDRVNRLDLDRATVESISLCGAAESETTLGNQRHKKGMVRMAAGLSAANGRRPSTAPTALSTWPANRLPPNAGA